MDLFEFQGKELFREAGLPVPHGRVVDDPAMAREAAGELGGRVVVKAQVQVGGRGKAGGIRLAGSLVEAEEAAEAILGMDIRGHKVERLLIEEASEIAQEMYAAMVLDRGGKVVVAMFSPMGGMDVEEISREHPESLVRVPVDPLMGWSGQHGRRLAFGARIDQNLVRPLGDIFEGMYRLLVDLDATLVEINPLISTSSGELMALDSKVSIDNNALFRHPYLAEMQELHVADPQEKMAREKGVTYVKLEGSIGVLGNGAGLVMSTLDVVADAGGKPANFLDVGGGAKADEIVLALEVITSDPDVRAIFFNIFGGITRCDEVARGVLTAIDRLGIEMPIVVRLDGTNEAEGRSILAEGGPSNLQVETTMLDAARRVVALAAEAA